ncbi:hypothetical protein BUALT_Bualt12G0062400 [Buddleja alternifolia]|uniref:CASP-like protein n=1 Tax=Buddleja alternifolia TaxID=168488 RepID=A0AAV6WN23_9LAMI|nr:hypothetical protein BUALT_Bualt12G0062400 [Buddleja alternifolia]
MDIGKKEAIVRILSIVCLVLTACLVGFDSETKVLFYTFSRRATFRDLNALCVLVWIVSAAAVYNLVQLFNGCILPSFRKDNQTNNSYRYLAWGFYLLDQVITTIYIYIYICIL